MTFDTKDKGSASPPKDKKKATLTHVAKKGETSIAALEEGTSANPSTVLGPRASMLGSPCVAEKNTWKSISTRQQGKSEKTNPRSGGHEVFSYH